MRALVVGSTVLCIGSIIFASVAMATQCQDNYKRFKKLHGQHSAFATSSGIRVFATHSFGIACAFEQRATLEEAEKIAVSICEKTGRKHHNYRECKVIEQR